MPYIGSPSRGEIDPTLGPLIDTLVTRAREWPEFQAGELNYVISRIVHALWNVDPRYITANTLVGAMECAKQEFLRRKVAPYEDEAIKRNGDL